MKRTVLLLIAIAGMALVSCSSLQTISFDRLEAADVNFPATVRNVAVVNNMPVVEAGKSHQEIRAQLEGDGKIASEALAERIADANYFDRVVICDSALRQKDVEPRTDVILSKEEVQQLATDLDVDLIFSFDRVHIETRPGVIFFEDYPIPVEAVEAAVTPVIRVYVPNRNGSLFVVSKQDTVSWELAPDLSEQIIVKEASEYAAAAPMEYLLPHWVETNRYYYDGGNVEMRDAGVCIREGDWEGAYKLWNKLYENKKGRVQMAAAFNLALYHEVKDDMKKAIEWAEKAKQLAKPGSREELQADIYIVALTERENRLTRLKMQMNRFDDNF